MNSRTRLEELSHVGLDATDESIFDTLKSHGPLDLVELVDVSGIAPDQVKASLGRLIHNGLVSRSPEQASNGTGVYRVVPRYPRLLGTRFARP